MIFAVVLFFSFLFFISHTKVFSQQHVRCMYWNGFHFGCSVRVCFICFIWNVSVFLSIKESVCCAKHLSIHMQNKNASDSHKTYLLIVQPNVNALKWEEKTKEKLMARLSSAKEASYAHRSRKFSKTNRIFRILLSCSFHFNRTKDLFLSFCTLLFIFGLTHRTRPVTQISSIQWESCRNAHWKNPILACECKWKQTKKKTTYTNISLIDRFQVLADTSSGFSCMSSTFLSFVPFSESHENTMDSLFFHGHQEEPIKLKSTDSFVSRHIVTEYRRIERVESREKRQK